jgi:arylsulfatase A-like enzyme
MNDMKRRRGISSRLVLGTILLIFATWFVSCSKSGPRLILLVIVDTMRADRLGCYGYESIDTKHMDRLAEKGTLYENAITAVPVTLPSITSILTGGYPVQHGIRDNGPYQLGDQWVTLAESMQQAGYVTGAFVSAAVLSHEHNLNQGFGVYDDDVSAPYEPYHPWMQSMRHVFQGIERRAGFTVDRALEWLGNQQDANVFMTVHLFDPHLPYDPPPPFRNTYDGRFYEGEIAYVDHELGRFLQGVRNMWRGSDIVTILVADHGEGLGDHDEYLHGDLLFEETVRVPLIVQGSGIPSGLRVKELVRTVDITPTICALAGIAPPDWAIGSPLPGIEFDDGPVSPRQRNPYSQVAYMETFRPRLSRNWCELRGLRTGRWKLVEGPADELYDLEADPKETVNVAAKYEAVVDSLVPLMNEVALWSVRRGSHFAASLELSEEQRRKLRSLGYVTPEKARPATTDSLAVWYFPPEERGRALGLPDPRTKVAASFRRNVAKSYYATAKAALDQGKLEDAEWGFKMAIQYKTNYADAYLGMAEVSRRAGRPQEALQHLRQARSIMPKDPAFAGELADGFASIDRLDEALEVVEDAIAGGFADSTLVEKKTKLREKIRGGR